jgi:hypothetical protein
MTLYLKVIVGNVDYLLPAARVTHVAPAEEDGADDTAVPEIDCRLLFNGPADTAGHRVSFAGRANLIVDRVDGLIELAEENFRPLPAIGRFGALIDAVSLPVAAEAPALRLQIGSAGFDEVTSAGRAG